MSANTADIALIGCGYWGKNLARNLHQLGRLAVICDTQPEILESAPRNYPGVRVTRSYSEVLSDAAISAVVIAAPAEQHSSLARQALQAGKDAFVEKPLSLKVAEAEELVALAKQNARVLMVGHILEYHPAIIKLKELVASGELGEIHYIYSNRLNLGKVRKEENILWSFAPHDIAVIVLLMGGLPREVATHGESYLQHEIADVTMTTLAFESKKRAHILVSWLHPFKEQKLVVIGGRKMAVFDDVAKEGKLKLYDKGIEFQNGEPVIRQTAETTLFFPEQEPLRLELVHFLDCVRKRETPRTDGENGLRVLRVLDACQRSLEAGGQPIKI
ncbi:MAG: Gfo/Idh/MocA family oxidoreductase [Vicinamibacteria bacterium]|jgi:UDP-2-acetamido-3-amino-2,3-dideoxy-glucuronate N-acetyltransferase|nr:Gfo/Idh/MocA family oxidoreductase [Vicinamibacteria bacterium]